MDESGEEPTARRTPKHDRRQAPRKKKSILNEWIYIKGSDPARQLGQDGIQSPDVDEDAEREAGSKPYAEGGREFFQKVFHSNSP